MPASFATAMIHASLLPALALMPCAMTSGTTTITTITATTRLVRPVVFD